MPGGPSSLAWRHDHQHVETLIIGAGQAGLCTGYFVAQQGFSFLIVDSEEPHRRQLAAAVGHPAALHPGQVRRAARPALPRSDSWHFPGKEEVADYLEAYALHGDLPVRTSARVEQLAPGPGGGYLADPRRRRARSAATSVVIATGTFGRTPWVPEQAGDLDPSILQLHPADRRRLSCKLVRCWWWGLPFGHGRGLRDGADPRGDAVRAGLRGDLGRTWHPEPAGLSCR